MLSQLTGGLWEVSLSASGIHPVRVCEPDPAALAQFTQRNRSCVRTILSQKPDEAVIGFTCGKGEFGQTRMILITPRSVRLETQGISGGLPFASVLHARLAGSCQGR